MKKSKDIKFEETQLLDLYAIMFGMAYADGELEKDELQAIYEVINTEGFSEDGKRAIQDYIVLAPDIDVHINNIKREIEELRFTCYVNAVEVAYSNYIIEESEERLLKRLKTSFGITEKQDIEIRKFVKEARRIKDRGIDDKYAEDALKSAMAGLGAVGVPVAAVYFCGSVVGLSAAGITSGLAALGLGMGMVPGIGMAIVIGAGIFIAVSKLLDVGGKRKKEKALKEKERRAQQVIKNLQESINHLVDKIKELEIKAKDADANKEAVKELSKRLKMLQQVVMNKKASV
ncbi:TerB family tellurite resistance protein [Romboutsia hominis]|uniref:Tellurite resistance protein TerB n=1 Tax=Romboutsia hominis TaxID=1507512 RepID=A0A2P2BQU5_9FIRM|nr:TerB family tellurite resistance protein [Romboutsia hominis]CEI72715.1 Tellurite resistance protein TerB [Romboutsia hominis]